MFEIQFSLEKIFSEPNEEGTIALNPIFVIPDQYYTLKEITALIVVANPELYRLCLNESDNRLYVKCFDRFNNNHSSWLHVINAKLVTKQNYYKFIQC